MKGHPKAGQPTYFVEKFVKSLHLHGIKPFDIGCHFSHELYHLAQPKHHTIRMGRHFKSQDELTVAVWSGKPYRSKQIKLWTGSIRTINVLIYSSSQGFRFMKQDTDSVLYQIGSLHLAKNDGLSHEDFQAWFKLPHGIHEAQILIWNPDIKY